CDAGHRDTIPTGAVARSLTCGRATRASPFPVHAHDAPARNHRRVLRATMVLADARRDDRVPGAPRLRLLRARTQGGCLPATSLAGAASARPCGGTPAARGSLSRTRRPF